MKNKNKKKDIHEECWNIDYELFKWIKEHFEVYLKDASKVVDLSYHTYMYKDTECDIETLMRIVIVDIDYLFGTEPYSSDYFNNALESGMLKTICEKKDEVYDILKIIHWDMWW